MEPHETLEPLARLKADLAERQMLEKRLVQAKDELTRIEMRRKELAAQLRKEGADVARLERTSLHSLFYTVLGSKVEQLQKERQEHLAARLKYEAAGNEKAALTAEIEEAKKRIEALAGLDQRHAELLRSTEADGEAARAIFAREEELGRLEGELREIVEALAAGRIAGGVLDELLGALSSAGGWGIWDMLGGGFLVTTAKHAQIDKAEGHALRAHTALGRFRRELGDVGTIAAQAPSVDLTGFLTFADFFFDNLIVDWIVQSRIQESEHQARRTRSQVTVLCQRLEAKRAEVLAAKQRLHSGSAPEV